MTAPRFAVLFLLALIAVSGGAASVRLAAEATQAPRISLDMTPSGNGYSDPGTGGDNSMTAGAIDQCVEEPANNNAHNRTAHLIIQNVEDLAGIQARFNFDSSRAAVSNFISAPFQDTSTIQNVGFLNLPLDPALGNNHRDLTGASDFTRPNTALVSASYLGDQSFPISPDTPAKSPTPDDNSYSAASGGILGSVVINVRAGQAGQPSLFVDLDDGSPNAPGSSVDIFTSAGISKLNLDEGALGDGYIGNGVPCLPLGPIPSAPPLPTPPPPGGDEPAAPGSDSPGGEDGYGTLEGPQQVNVSSLPSGPFTGANSGGSAEVDSPLSPGPSEPSPLAPLANAVDSSSSPPAISTARFEGLDNDDNAALRGFRVQPPDPQVAVGPGHVVAMVNGLGEIYTRTGTSVRAFSLASFFAVPGTDNPSDPTSFRGIGPKLLYDGASDRWFATYVSRRDLPGASVDQGLLHIAVSQTSDPTGTWDVSSRSFLHEYPDHAGLGLTSDKVTISANLFDIDNQDLRCPKRYCGEQTFVLEKADLLAGTTVSLFAFPVRTDRFTVRPAHSLTSVSDQYLAARGFDYEIGDWCSVLTTTLTLIRITGTPDAGNVTQASATNLPIRQQTQPPTELVQPEITNIDLVIDCRMLEATWQFGRLWASATTGCNLPGDTQQRSCAHLIEVNTANNSVTQDIVFGDVGSYYTYPAIRTDISGDLYVSFSHFSSGNFPEARVAGRRSFDAPNEMNGSAVVRGGETWYCPLACFPTRWGAYLGAAVDPELSGCVWVIGEYAKNIAEPNWGTYIAATSYDGGGSCLDSDNDRWSDAIETIIGTDPLDGCPDTTADNAWPADLNNDTFSDGTDITIIAGSFGKAVPPAPARRDIAPVFSPDGIVDGTDITVLAGFFGDRCGA